MGTPTNSDEGNRGFGSSKNLAQHKPGVEYGTVDPAGHAGGNHQFRQSPRGEIPRESLAELIAKSKREKGGR